MAEWLLLLLLVPAIVVPVVLLVGFAGCNQVFGLRETEHFPPVIDEARGLSATIIHVIWHWDGGGRNFELQRTNPDGTTVSFENISDLFLNDTDLTPNTMYSYQVRNLSPGDNQDLSDPVTGTTLPLEPTFTQTLTSDGINWQGFTLVQRIEPNRLFRSGTQVLLTLHASSTREALLDRIYISKHDPAAADPYQPDTDLTALYDNPNSPQTVPKNTPQTSPLVVGPVNYNLDHTQALLIAFEFHASPESDIAFADVATADASAYYIQASEAASHPRSTGYTPVAGRVYLVERIEVG